MLRNIRRLFRMEPPTIRMIERLMAPSLAEQLKETEDTLIDCRLELYGSKIAVINLEDRLKHLSFRYNQISKKLEKLEEEKKENSAFTTALESHFGVRNSDETYR